MIIVACSWQLLLGRGNPLRDKQLRTAQNIHDAVLCRGALNDTGAAFLLAGVSMQSE